MSPEGARLVPLTLSSEGAARSAYAVGQIELTTLEVVLGCDASYSATSAEAFDHATPSVCAMYTRTSPGDGAVAGLSGQRTTELETNVALTATDPAGSAPRSMAAADASCACRSVGGGSPAAVARWSASSCASRCACASAALTGT